MAYARFLFYNVFGGFVWTSLFIFGGYFFGNLDFVKGNFSFVIIGIIVISVLPITVELLRNRLRPEERAVG